MGELGEWRRWSWRWTTLLVGVRWCGSGGSGAIGVGLPFTGQGFFGLGDVAPVRFVGVSSVVFEDHAWSC